MNYSARDATDANPARGVLFLKPNHSFFSREVGFFLILITSSIFFQRITRDGDLYIDGLS